MICQLIVCAIIAGTATQCDLEKPPELVPLPRELAATWQECRDAARELRNVTPANLRIVRFEFYTPEKHEQEDKSK
jgi:hypothetical protein